MIAVDLLRITLPEGWIDRATNAQQELERCTTAAARGELFRRRDDVWRDLVDALSELSCSKCWYCETQIVRFDARVDHYRPKGGVLEDRSHPGYWWLGFSVENFRLCCQFCNERRVKEETAGGKATHFPLLDGGIRAMKPGDDTGDEYPILLDPTVGRDPSLLKFLLDGRVVARYAEHDRPDAYTRATQSIEILHLHEGRLVQQRAQVCQEAREAASRVDATYVRMIQLEQSGAHPRRQREAGKAFTDAVQRMVHLCAHQQPYLAAVRDVVRAEPNDRRAWLDEVLAL